MARNLAKATAPASRRSKFMQQTERRVLEYTTSRGILSLGERVVVAVSGGADSTALLLILDRLSKRFGIDVTVAYFDHRLRGKDEADADIAYVSELCATLGLPFSSGSGNVRARAQRRGESLEDAARRTRYSFLKRCAKTVSATVVVTGHTLDDQAETVLLHLVRGSGLDGLAGMRPRTPWPFDRGPAVARPLLCISRADTEKYCAESAIIPRHDETNRMLNASRNRMRMRVLPELRAINPRVSDALARLADNVASDAAFLATAADVVYQRIAQRKSNTVSIARKDLAALPRPMAVRVIQQAIEAASGTRTDFESVHLEDVLRLTGKPPAKICLPSGISAQSDSTWIQIHKGPQSYEKPLRRAALTIPGTTTVDGWTFEAKHLNVAKSPSGEDRFTVRFDRGAVEGSIGARSRLPGDSLRPLGLGGRKKVQDILVDAKVPSRQRDSVPIVYDEAGILWVVGHCLDERVAMKPGAREVLQITARHQTQTRTRGIV